MGIKLTAVQFGPGPGDLSWLREALRAEKPDLAVLPELANTHYFPLEATSAHAHAPATLDGPLVSELQGVARDAGSYVLAGLYLEDQGAKANSAIMISPGGEIVPGRDGDGGEHLAYRKVHLCNITTSSAQFREEDYFRSGDRHVVWDTTIGRVGCLICYDRHFPEAWRIMRHAGVDIVAVPVASPETSRAWFVAEMQAMSLQQGLYAVAANRAGTEFLSSGVETTYAGLSCITAPNGAALAVAPFAEANRVVSAIADRKVLSRSQRENRFFMDRRNDLYAAEADGWAKDPS